VGSSQGQNWNSEPYRVPSLSLTCSQRRPVMFSTTSLCTPLRQGRKLNNPFLCLGVEMTSALGYWVLATCSQNKITSYRPFSLRSSMVPGHVRGARILHLYTVPSPQLRTPQLLLGVAQSRNDCLSPTRWMPATKTCVASSAHEARKICTTSALQAWPEGS
jgi:hypothetical protein